MTNEAERPTTNPENYRRQAVKICKGDAPVPEDGVTIAFLAQRAQKAKASGDVLKDRASKLEEALGIVQRELLMTQGAIDGFIDSIAELLEAVGETKPKDPGSDLEADHNTPSETAETP